MWSDTACAALRSARPQSIGVCKSSQICLGLNVTNRDLKKIPARAYDPHFGVQRSFDEMMFPTTWPSAAAKNGPNRDRSGVIADNGKRVVKKR